MSEAHLTADALHGHGDGHDHGNGHGHGHEVSVGPVALPASHPLAKLGIVGLALAAVGLGGAFTLKGGDSQGFYFSYLTAYMFFLSLGIGSMFFVLFQHATHAGWSASVRRLFETTATALPAFAILFIPIVLGMHDLYEWTHEDVVAHDHILTAKQPYLNTGFFYIRAAVYFLIWTGLSLTFYFRSVKQDTTKDPALSQKMQGLSYPSIALMGLSMTFAVFDWVMSLQPHWYSTIFGVWYFAGSVLGALCFNTLLGLSLSKNVLKGKITVEHFHDLGKLTFGFVVFWTYIAFSQYMLIWYANIPEETVFFKTRFENGWMPVTYAYTAAHFLIPFAFLMSRHMKRNRVTLGIAAVWLLAVHYLDMYWNIIPARNHGEHVHPFHFGAVDVLTLVGVGGVFLFVVATMLKKNSVIAGYDPRLNEAFHLENL